MQARDPRPRTDKLWSSRRRAQGPRDREDGWTVWFSTLDFLDKVAPEFAMLGGYSRK